MRYISLLLLIALTTPFMNCCSDDSNTTEPDFNNFRVPFGEVIRWTYEREMVSGGDLHDTVEIDYVDKLVRNDSIFHKLDSYFEDNADDEILFHLQNQEGYFLGAESDFFVKLLAYPIKDGYSEELQGYREFDWAGKDGKTQIDTARQILEIQTNEKVNINGSTYNCIFSNIYNETKDGEKLPAEDLKFYFAKDIGLIKIYGNLNGDTAHKVISLELLSYAKIEN